jgi:DNA helicase IV
MHETDLDAEQRLIDHAYVALAAMAERAEIALKTAQRDAQLTDAIDFGAIQAVLRNRVAAFADSKAPLTFGRIDEGVERFYIGRRHVEDAHGEPLVVDWRAGVSAPFYRATWADPLGLDRRRRFALDARTLVGVFDEDFSDPDGVGGSGGVPDPLLAELDRARTGAMRDIVSTIQAEQDIIIRAPLEDLLVVQGGPGTGKTAVGLHRAAFLLYANREHFQRKKLLVVGPNRLFLAYISEVLPSLGETAVVQATIETLNSRAFPVRSVEPGPVARLKGDPRMVEILRRAISRKIAEPDAIRAGPDTDVMTSFGGATIAAGVVADILEEITARMLPSNTARDVFREQLIAEVWKARARRVDANPEHQHAFTSDLRSQTPFKTTLDRWWPSLGAASTLRSILGSVASLRKLAGDLFTDEEIRLLVRSPAKKVSDERWTRGDLALLDDLTDRIVGDIATFGHVVVDEVQDLSAMELRMVARRSPNRSITALGDLAQATGVAGQESWADALAQLGHRRGDVRGRGASALLGAVNELTLGYRVPERLIDYANLLLPVASPGLVASKSVRAGGEAPTVVEAFDLLASVSEQALALAADHALVGVLVPPSLLDAAYAVLRTNEASIPVHDARTAAGLGDGINVLAGEAAKGLEFDAVVVVEPAMLIDEHASGRQSGYRTLFVALTRATQRVVVVHSIALPSELVATGASMVR